ncbi:MAG: hypothetical protein OXC44_02290 [Proteobacteria bacterium]|nr:hypothetical protein [Pseudomonadota bacterium]
MMSLEIENEKLVAYVGTAYHCLRTMAEEDTSGEADEYAFYLNIDPDSTCEIKAKGKTPNFVKVPFDLNNSEYLKQLTGKVQRLKSYDPNMDIAKNDRTWLEKSFNVIPNPSHENILKQVRENLKLSDNIVDNMATFNINFDRYSCSTSSELNTNNQNPSYAKFHNFVSGKAQTRPKPQVSNACFLSSDVVFFKIYLDKFYLQSRAIAKCLATSYLKTENSDRKAVPIKLSMGHHPQRQSEWSKAVVSFHNEALKLNNQHQASISPDVEAHHRNMFNQTMEKTFRDKDDLINHGTEDEHDDFMLNVHEIGGTQSDQYHLRLLTFHKQPAEEHLQFKNLKLAYTKNQLEVDGDFMELFGNIYAIFLRHWGVSLMLTGLKIHPGSSGSLMIAGNDKAGYEVMTALYSKDGREYNTTDIAIDSGESIGLLKSTTYTTQLIDNNTYNNDSTHAELANSNTTTQTPHSQDQVKRQESRKNQSTADAKDDTDLNREPNCP